MIGDMASYSTMKKNITRTTRVVSFFNGSHYWGGQLKQIAAKEGITRSMKQNCESRWYALGLQAVSVQAYKYVLLYLPNFY